MYKITVNGQKINLKGTIEDSLGYVAHDFVELVPTEKFEIVIKRKLSSRIMCFLSNIGNLKDWVKVKNSVKYSIENPQKTDGEIIIRLNQGLYHMNSIFVSEGLVLRD